MFIKNRVIFRRISQLALLRGTRTEYKEQGSRHNASQYNPKIWLAFLDRSSSILLQRFILRLEKQAEHLRLHLLLQSVLQTAHAAVFHIQDLRNRRRCKLH